MTEVIRPVLAEDITIKEIPRVLTRPPSHDGRINLSGVPKERYIVELLEENKD